MMMKPPIDQDALIDTFAKATAKQGEALRQAVSSATLKALQQREVTLDGVRQVVGSVVGAASSGLAKNGAPKVDVEAMLGSALAGIDGALLQAVDANRKAIEQFMSRGSTLADKPLQDALATVEKMEDTFFATVSQAGKSAGTLHAPWANALASFKAQGSGTGAEAGQLAGTMLEQARDSVRQTRAAGMRASQAVLSGYAAMVSGILIGMSEGMRAGASAKGSTASSTAPGERSAAPAAAPAAPPARKAPSRRASAKRKAASR